ncbi:Melanization protease 1 [Blattella germanica]|nr:Melanization protease 1 [Blattella germanica]
MGGPQLCETHGIRGVFREVQAIGSKVLGLMREQIGRENGEKCTTPDNKLGQCINIKGCPSVLALLTQSRPIPADVLDFLRRSQCGFEGRTPLVCCAVTSDTPTPPPITRPPVSEPGVSGPVDVSNHPNLRLLPLNICGPYTENKILNGKETEVFEYPWMALIGYNRAGTDRRVYRCGGTILNEKYILTAAHCLVSLPSTLKLAGVRLGEHDLLKNIDCMEDDNGVERCADPPQDFDLDEVIPHPSYSALTLQNDIGLIRIKGTANFGLENVKPICVPIGSDQRRNLVGMKLIVSGWGTTEKGLGSNVLLKVAVPVVSQEQCATVYNRSTYRRPITITQTQICAGGENAEDSCDGDSGGPLIYEGQIGGRPRFVQYGIVSFGPRSCGIKEFPAVYTKVAHYVDWILSNMRP